MKNIQDACLAVRQGEALGYPVKFLSAEEIFAIYGEKGICYYQLSHGKAQISDDTQMTLFTAAGLMVCEIYKDEKYGTGKYCSR